MRLGRRALMLGATVLTAAAVASCSADNTWVHAEDTAAWPGMYGDSRNASYTDADAAQTLVPAWNRGLHGANTVQPAISNRGIVSVTARTETGCSTFNLELTVGRKTYCRRDAPGADLQAPLVDQFDYTYLGIPGWMYSFNPDNQVRWRYPTAGAPLWLKLVGDNSVLGITHLGQMVIVDSHDGVANGASIGLLPKVSADANAAGLDDCRTAAAATAISGPDLGGPGCPVAGPPAVDVTNQRAFVVVGGGASAPGRPGAGPAKVMAVDYSKTGGSKHDLRYAWERTDIADGVIGSPALSADGSTVYVNLRSKKLAALDAKTGATKWTHDLGYATTVPPSVSPDGVIIPAAPGLQRNSFLALQDQGDSAREVFKRTDVAMVSPATQIKGGVGYAVVRSWAGVETQLLEFRTDTGTTLRTFPLPDTVKSTSGVSVGPDGELVTVGQDGDVFAFTSGRRTGDSVAKN
ncbi:PQQ-binding-like beta-propeller repeat protein [Tsukamurella sp. 1534]|uniref:PQQ-binding-like beta-propeller repeat protein n=1 Tax=Tsukamurella sp. 1534 TaxID=1151061 RepID=UPI0002DD72FC|nr:PQQ-binding-like beta-propeller repeat protein [Tsukamurella sp. 1534]